VVVTETEIFRTERLLARSWHIEDLPFAMELWGDPAVTALIDARGKLSRQQVEQKLRTEIDRERSDRVQYLALFDHGSGDFVGCAGLRPWLYTPGEANLELGFHIVQRCWGKGLATEAARGVLDHCWAKMRLAIVYAGHHPANRASRRILDKLGFEFLENVFYAPTGLMHPSYVRRRSEPTDREYPQVPLSKRAETGRLAPRSGAAEGPR
jgi:[ribosomal protein S5]-alanine N-acetyltransferase